MKGYGLSVRGTRAIHLIDLENLAGVGRLTDDAAGWAIWSYLNSVEVGRDDHVVIAVDAQNAFAAFAAYPTARILIGHGKNGADNRLVEVLRHEHIDERFAQAYVASGDGIFTNDAGRLVGLGMVVTVVTLPGHDAKGLREVSSEVRYIGIPGDGAEVK